MENNKLTQYSQARSSIETGDAIAFHGSGLGSWLIQTFTKGPYSHIAMAMWVTCHEEKRLMIAHANFPEGVTLVFLSNYIKNYNGKVDLYKFNHQEAFKKEPDYQRHLADWALIQTGRKYDVKGVLRFIAPFMKQQLSKYFCSELYAAGWREAVGFDVPVQITPNKLVEWDMFVSHEPVCE